MESIIHVSLLNTINKFCISWGNYLTNLYSLVYILEYNADFEHIKSKYTTPEAFLNKKI